MPLSLVWYCYYLPVFGAYLFMAQDPAFLFYPGDYLRDTQCLSEKVQVAYDRIMCEHMRNICITQQQLKFFTKKLSEDEIDELKMVLTEIEGGYQIKWVAESIVKRRDYSESRRKNRTSVKKDKTNISKTYDSHMENEIENEIKDVVVIEKKIWQNSSQKKWVDDNCPTTLKMQKPLTEEGLNKLIAEFGMTKVEEKLLAMENMPSLKKKYKDAVSTCRSWCKKDEGKDTRTITEKLRDAEISEKLNPSTFFNIYTGKYETSK